MTRFASTRRDHLRLAIGLSTALLAFAACRTTPSPATDRAQVVSALAAYDSLILVMDHDGLANTYTADGETVDGDQTPIRGPASIRTHLLGFSAFHVLANRLDAESTRVSADTAWQEGTYWQRVQVPAGDTVEVSGRFNVVWLQTRPGLWQIRRMHTFRPMSSR